jgi:type VI secretion system protein
MNALEAKSDKSCAPNRHEHARCERQRYIERALRASIFAAIAITINACALIPFIHSGPVHTRSFVISATADANDNAPTTVDAVMIYNPAVVPTVLAMTAKQWFEKREQLKNDFPGGYEMREWEVVPGAQVDISKLPFRSGGVGLFVFANYPGAGDHRARLDAWQKPRIALQGHAFTVAETRK